LGEQVGLEGGEVALGGGFGLEVAGDGDRDDGAGVNVWREEDRGEFDLEGSVRRSGSMAVSVG
jgi:hypothetical protein